MSSGEEMSYAAVAAKNADQSPEEALVHYSSPPASCLVPRIIPDSGFSTFSP